MIEKIIAATTHIDRHFHKITKEALEKAAEEINSGRKTLFTIEHDLTIPPLGKGVRAWVEPRDDGEHQLIIEHDIFEDGLRLENQSGDILIKQESKVDHNPFVDRYGDMEETLFISYDPINFASKADFRAFITEINSEYGREIPASQFGRKSYIPDPEVWIGIVKTIGGFLLATKIVNKIGNKVAELAEEDVADFYKYVRSIVHSSIKHLSPKNRPITYVFVIKGEPTIEFIIKTTDAELVISSVKLDNLSNALSQAESYYNLFRAEKIQYLFEDGKWKFNYLLTDKGGVVGTPVCFSRRAERFELLQKQIKESESE